MQQKFQNIIGYNSFYYVGFIILHIVQSRSFFCQKPLDQYQAPRDENITQSLLEI